MKNTNIGEKVIKIRPSGGETNQPFKSGLKINTIKSIVNHPVLNTPAFSFVEDDSIVECRRCKIVKETHDSTN